MQWPTIRLVQYARYSKGLVIGCEVVATNPDLEGVSLPNHVCNKWGN